MKRMRIELDGTIEAQVVLFEEQAPDTEALVRRSTQVIFDGPLTVKLSRIE